MDSYSLRDTDLTEESGGTSSKGDGGTLESISDTLLHWSGLIGCKRSTTGNIINKVPVPTDATTMEVTDYLGCPAAKKMSFLKLNGGGHAWPSGLNQPKVLLGNTIQEIDGAAFVWQFVKDVSK